VDERCFAALDRATPEAVRLRTERTRRILAAMNISLSLRPVVVFLGVLALPLIAAAGAVEIATFNVDATPPIGAPVAYKPARTIEDPLSARGIVLIAEGQQPIVLVAVDSIGIANEAHDLWREKLAVAAGTTPERVSVHALHQHDATRSDFSSERLLAERGLGGERHNDAFDRDVVERAAAAVRDAHANTRRVTHIGIGRAKVEKVASNRRILGEDGKVKIVRYSASRNPEAIAAPEGVIDPWLRCVSFWDAETPIASLTYYATHPQSYYGQGDVTAEFVGLARAKREQDLPEVAHIHFNGASGNVAAGKYNDGSPEARVALTQRMHAGMKAAWEATEKQPLESGDVEWRTNPVTLPLGAHLQSEPLLKVLDDPDASAADKLTAAKHLAWLQRTESGRQIDLGCLRLGDVYVLHMPGELFIEYQLAAQEMQPDATVCMAAYGEYGPGYIGTDIAYEQGGYESSERASRVGPGVERVLMDAMRKLLNE
jgi:hypothetical protein